jgi:hypothetical protein
MQILYPTTATNQEIADKLNVLPGKPLRIFHISIYGQVLGLKRPSAHKYATRPRDVYLTDLSLGPEPTDRTTIRLWAIVNDVELGGDFQSDLKRINTKRRELGLPGFTLWKRPVTE